MNKELSFTLLSCGRIELLKRTVESTFSKIDDISKIEKIFVEDNFWNECNEYITSTRLFDVNIAHGSRKGIGAGLNTLFSYVNTDYVFNMQNDWECCASNNKWLWNALDILKEDEDIGIVRLRKRNDRQGWWADIETQKRSHPWNFDGDILPPVVVHERTTMKGYKFLSGFGMIFRYNENPHLIRRFTIEQLKGRIESAHDKGMAEIDYQHRFDAIGLGVAKLLEDVYFHIG